MTTADETGFDPFRWVEGAWRVSQITDREDRDLFVLRACWLAAAADEGGEVEIPDEDVARFALFVDLCHSVGIRLLPNPERYAEEVS